MRVLSSKEFEEHAEKVRTVGKGEAMHESGVFRRVPYTPSGALKKVKRSDVVRSPGEKRSGDGCSGYVQTDGRPRDLAGLFHPRV